MLLAFLTSAGSLFHKVGVATRRRDGESPITVVGCWHLASWRKTQVLTKLS